MSKLLQTPIKPIKNGAIGTAYGRWGQHWSWHIDKNNKWISGKLEGLGQHRGVDFPCPTLTPCLAVVDGEISYHDSHPKLGIYLILKAPNDVNITYAHLSFVLVPEGTKVKQGELIAKSGSTGNSTGPHLHIEFRDAKTGQWFKPEFI